MRLSLACFALLLTACPEPSADAGKTAAKPAAKPEAKPADTKAADKPADTKAADKPEAKAAAKPADGPTATVRDDVPFPLAQMLGKKPDEIQPKLGEPTGKGLVRKSCIRFLPERTWFDCAFTLQRYLDPNSTYAAITVTYEDGISTGISFEGIPGEGAFDPKAALAHTGVTLVGEPKQSQPEENVTLWTWFNGSARLLVDGKQYRVEVSSVDGQWGTSRVEYILNHPLTADQQARVRAPKSAD